MNSSMKSQATYVVLFALILSCGCNDKVLLRGRVTFSDDGSPLTAGIVHFSTDTYVARGVLKKDGSYVVGSVAEKDGLPEGTYHVYIENADEIIGEDSSGAEIRKSLINSKFTSRSTSEISVDVDRSTRRFDFQVDRASP